MIFMDRCISPQIKMLPQGRPRGAKMVKIPFREFLTAVSFMFIHLSLTII
jgi:hypothetical protein